MPRNAEETRARICRSALNVMIREASSGFTVELVANEARCAKGLVHYHFRTKNSLLAEVVRRNGIDRLQRWRKALSAPVAQEAIEMTWALIESEVPTAELIVGGLARLDSELKTSFRKADADFSELLGGAVQSLMRRTGLEFDVPATHAGALLAAVANGSVARLAGGATAVEVEEAYALAWLSLLSLTVPITGV